MVITPVCRSYNISLFFILPWVFKRGLNHKSLQEAKVIDTYCIDETLFIKTEDIICSEVLKITEQTLDEKNDRNQSMVLTGYAIPERFHEDLKKFWLGAYSTFSEATKEYYKQYSSAKSVANLAVTKDNDYRLKINDMLDELGISERITRDMEIWSRPCKEYEEVVKKYVRVAV